VSEAVAQGRWRVRAGPGAVLVPAGIALTLIGVIGDLLGHTLNPSGHTQEALIVLGRGNNPWHLVLFAGIVVTTLGGVRWASRLSSEAGGLIGAALFLLLIATLVLGAYSGWKAADHTALAGSVHVVAAVPEQADGAGAGTSSGTAAGDHASHQGAAATGEGAEGASNFGGHSHGQPGPTTEREWLILGRQLAAAEAATRRYRSIARARADGYFQVTQFIPGLGLHMANLHIRQDVFDPAHPQLLLYMPKRDSGYALAGVGYMFVHRNDVPPEGFAGGQDVWHFHNNLCFLPDGSVTLAPDRAACRVRSGVFQKQTAWLLHAWIWRANPNGVFVEANPRVF
jgi:hypothetical protein